MTPGTAKSDIVALLYQNDEYCYYPQKVAEDLDMNHNTAKGTLRRLKRRGFIDQTEDGYYYARHDREDMYRYVSALDGLDQMFTEHGDTATDQEAIAEPSQSLSEEEIDEVVGIIDEKE